MKRKDVLKELCATTNYCNLEKLEKIKDAFPCFDIGDEVYCVLRSTQENPIIGTVVTIRTMETATETLMRYSVVVSDGDMLEFATNDINKILFRSILDANIKLADVKRL
jgi:hypothetical protein